MFKKTKTIDGTEYEYTDTFGSIEIGKQYITRDMTTVVTIVKSDEWDDDYPFIGDNEESFTRMGFVFEETSDEGDLIFEVLGVVENNKKEEEEATNFGFIHNPGKSLTIFARGTIYNIPHTHINFKTILNEVKDNDSPDVDKIVQLADVITHIATETQGKFVVRNGMLVDAVSGLEARGFVASSLKKILSEAGDVGAIARFVENLSENPSQNSIEELYLFLKRCDMPITEDGHFLAYKAVARDYKDKHSGTIRNMVGDCPRMKRQDVDDDRRVACSNGLHVGTYRYAKGFMGCDGHLMVVKVNPKDVVSVPYDEDDSKCRVEGYQVIGEVRDVQRDSLKTLNVVGKGNYEAYDF